MAPRIAVIGAGVAGLTCALDLQERGFAVEVFERDASVGGRMKTRRRDGFAFDCGAAFLADCYSSLGSLAARVGATVESVGLVRHVVLRDGRFHRLNFSRLSDALYFGGLGPWTRARALVLAGWAAHRWRDLDFFDLSTIPEELLDESAYAFACRTAGAEFADYVVDPFTSTMMFHRAHDICSGAFLALFAMMASGRASFGIRRVVGGMQALPAAIARRVPVQTGCAVEGLEPEPGGVRLWAPGVNRTFDAAVVACPAPAALSLLVRPTPAQAELLLGTSYSSTIDVSFRVPVDALSGLHCVYVPYRESTLISEFTNEAIKEEDTVRAGLTLVNVGLHEAGARTLADASDAVVFERVKSELTRLSPALAACAAAITPHDLVRWPHAIPRYGGAQVARAAHFWKHAQGEGGLWFCGDYLNHPWLEGAARSGARVATRLAATAAPLTSASRAAA